MPENFRSPHRLLSVLLVATSIGAIVVACDAKVETQCFDGDCSNTTSGSGGTAGMSGSAGSGGGNGGSAPVCATTAEDGDFPCDVFDILSTSCQKCHNELQEFGAPIDLLTCGRFHEKDCNGNFRLMTGQNYVRTKFMPLGSMFPITSDQRMVLQTWLDACSPCMPKGMGCSATTTATLACYKKMP